MAPARKKSRKLGLEEEAPGGGGQTVSSSEEENKKLYVFVMHHSGNYPYSLFALDIPSPGTVVKTVVTPPSYETVKGVEHKIPSRTEPERSQVRPILRFPHGKGWGRFMKCIRLGQKLYFLGGHCFEGRPRTYPREVRALDVSQGVESRHRDRADKVVVQVASMNTGKDGTIVSFVADGKIFVVGSRKKEGQAPFEIFDPSEDDGKGVWRIGAVPPFEDNAYLYQPLVVGRKVFFCGQMVGMRHFSCCYMIDDETWIDYITSKKDVNVSFLGFGGGFSCTPADLRLMAGGVAIGETLWNVVVVEANNVPAVVRFDISKKQVNKKYYKSGLMYYIQHHPSAADVDDLIDYGPGTFLTREEDSRHLVFLQVEKSGVDRIRMSIILFDTPAGDRRESPKYLTSAHYFVKLDPSNPTYTLMDAHIVEDFGLDPDRVRMSIILFDTPAAAGDRRESPKYLTSAHYFVKLDRSNPIYVLRDAHIV